MQITDHFELTEFLTSETARREGILNTPGKQEIENIRTLCEKVLEPARQALGKPIVVTSGYRSKQLNKKINGAKNSYHLYGKAADIRCEDNNELCKILMKMTCTELIVYRHRGTKAIDRFHVAYNDGQKGIPFTKFVV